MRTEAGTECRCAERITNHPLPLTVAARMAGVTPNALKKAILRGRLRGTPMPEGNGRVHWQVRVGDLADYSRRTLSPEWLALVEQSLSWQPGQEVRKPNPKEVRRVG